MHTQKYSNLLAKTKHFILSSTIFHNIKITIGNKPIYIKEWDQKGVKNINDLIHETGAFLLQEEFERIYNIKTNFVQFLGLKQAIMAYAGTHKITSFSKELHAPLLPANILLLIKFRERSGSVVECLTRDQGPRVRASPASLRCGP